jgi:hypothetical protein
MAIFLLPLAQFSTNFFEEKKLDGYIIEHDKPRFEWKEWFNNSYQNQYDKYFNQKFGFRNFFVRSHNQLDYSLFNQLHANGVVVGKDDYLYEKNYIKSYMGTDYIGEKEIKAKINEIKSIYQFLKANNTDLLLIIAPGKGYFYPEYIPEDMMQERGPTNYEGYVEELSKTNIPYIDFNHLFLEMKDTSSIILYPKTGIHWSQASIALVMDSIIRKTEYILGADLPDLSYSYNPLEEAEKIDRDIEKGLNLFHPIKIPQMHQAIMQFESDHDKTKPKMICIADSFFWQLYGRGYTKNFFSDVQFWYYYKKIYAGGLEDRTIDDINIKEELSNCDVVLLLSTEANLYKFPFGFESLLKSNASETIQKE